MWIRTNDTVVSSAARIGAPGAKSSGGPQVRQAGVVGVNRVYRHVRRSQRNPQGGRLSEEMPIQISNVLLVCRSCGKATRTRGAVGQ